MNLADINAMQQQEFTSVLADIFEHSPWVAERAWVRRPFRDVAELHQVMVEEVAGGGLEAQLALLRAHPELAGKEAQSGDLTSASESEQAGANLNSLSSEEMAAITRLNAQYMSQFGFPFIIAVRNHDRAGIFSELERRVANELDTERATALEQVAHIARFRLDDLLG